MTVTFMVNSACNLRCQHCYLPAGQTNILLSDDVIEWVFASQQLDGVLLVGMEPLMNDRVAHVSGSIGQRCRQAGLPLSLITNGMRLSEALAQPVLDTLVATGGVLDVSLDGGPDTYSRRGGNWARIVHGLCDVVTRHPQLRVCILHTMWQGWSRRRVEDSLRVLDVVPQIHRVQYSLYIDVDGVADGRRERPSQVAMQEALALLAGCQRFMDDNRCVLVIDEYNARAAGMTLPATQQYAADLHFPLRVRTHDGSFTGHLLLEGDPIHRGGYLRIQPTLGGALVLSPWDSLHTATYAKYGRPWDTHEPFDEAARHVIEEYLTRYPA